jgi:hypothetical protein
VHQSSPAAISVASIRWTLFPYRVRTGFNQMTFGISSLSYRKTRLTVRSIFAYAFSVPDPSPAEECAADCGALLIASVRTARDSVRLAEMVLKRIEREE